MKEVLVDSDALNALMSGFEVLLSGQAPRLEDWLENEYEMTEKEFDTHMKKLGKAVGRDFGIL
jgi:tetrahydromethanopterin S-methyltransferase subunit G